MQHPTILCGDASLLVDYADSRQVSPIRRGLLLVSTAFSDIGGNAGWIVFSPLLGAIAVSFSIVLMSLFTFGQFSLSVLLVIFSHLLLFSFRVFFTPTVAAFSRSLSISGGIFAILFLAMLLISSIIVFGVFAISFAPFSAGGIETLFVFGSVLLDAGLTI